MEATLSALDVALAMPVLGLMWWRLRECWMVWLPLFVRWIRFNETLILSYAVKYASAMYGPFRDAASSVNFRRPSTPSNESCTTDGSHARSRLG